MKKPLVLIIVGAILLAIGGMLHFGGAGGAPKADSALMQQCQQKMKAENAEPAMIQQCDEKTFATAMTATDAQSAATAISAANNSEVGGSMMSMFFIGVGLALLAGGVYLQRTTKSATTSKP